MHKQTILIILFSALVLPTSAFAKVSKKAKEEIAAYATKNASLPDESAKVAWLMTQGLLVSKKERSVFEPYKTDESEAIRLGAGLGLLLAGDRKAGAFIQKELEASTQRRSLLRLYVSALPNKVETKLLLTLINKAKPNTAVDYIRYIAETPEHLPTFQKLLKKKKTSQLAWKGYEALSPKVQLKLTKANLSHKNLELRRKFLNRLIAMSDWPEYYSQTKPLLKTLAKTDKDRGIRIAAIKALVIKKDTAAQKLMVKMIDDAKDEEKAGILKFLVDQNAKVKVDKFIKSKNKEESRLAYILSARGNKKLGKKFLEMYRSTEFDERMTAVQAVPYTRSAEAITILSNAIFEGDRKIRFAAAKGLILLGSPKALGALKRALENERDKEIKLLVIDAIGATKSSDALQILRFQVTTRDRDVKIHTIQAVHRIKKSECAKALTILLRDRDLEVQWTAFLAMMDLDLSQAKKHFKSVFRNPVSHYLDDIDNMEKAQRKVIYHWLFQNGGPSVKQDLTLRSMRYHQFEDQIATILNDSALSTKMREDVIFYLINSDLRSSKLHIESFVRKSLSRKLSRRAIWALIRGIKKQDEATFRGFLGLKDKVASSVATYGFALIQK